MFFAFSPGAFARAGRGMIALLILILATCPAPSEPEEAWQFFAIGDTRTNVDTVERIARSMAALDPEAAACINNGDVTAYGRADEWEDHLRALAGGAPDPTAPPDPGGIPRGSLFRTNATEFGPYIRYFAALGNHDVGSEGWFERWNTYLPGQRDLGVSSPDGIYFSFTYANARFIVLDSVHPSDDQTQWLEAELQRPAARDATWIFVFLHHPIYPCNDKAPFRRGLEWVELFERYGVDIAFVAHSHTYERTCPMIGGSCAEGGVVYLNTSAAGAPARAVDETRHETVTYGERSDEYDCREILEAARGRWHHFCHIEVSGCALTLSCYSEDWSETGEPPFDSVVLDNCSDS